MIYHTSFKLNIVNFSRALPPGHPSNPPNPTEHRSQYTQTPSCVLFPNSGKMQNFFSFLANALWCIEQATDIMEYSVCSKNRYG